MGRVNFEDLKVYRLAEDLADKIWNVTTNWNHFARDTVGKQLVRAADSIGANIAEGEGRGSYKENKRFVRIARGSVNETRHWLRRAFRRGLLSTQEIDGLKPLIAELPPRLNAYLRSIGTKNSPSNDGPCLTKSGTQRQGTNDKGPVT